MFGLFKKKREIELDELRRRVVDAELEAQRLNERVAELVSERAEAKRVIGAYWFLDLRWGGRRTLAEAILEKTTFLEKMGGVVDSKMTRDQHAIWKREPEDLTPSRRTVTPEFVRALCSKEREKLVAFVRDVARNWDCDDNAHKHGTTCRVCDAEQLLRDLGEDG